MPIVAINIEGRDQLRRQLQKLGGPAVRSLSRKIVRDAMAPVLSAAQVNVPVHSGRIRASLGELVSTRSTSATAKVGTRRDFSYVNTSGDLKAHGRGKQRDRALQKGARKDVKTAQQYARVIEFGVDKTGRVRRKAGGAHFLENAIGANTGTVINFVASEFRRYVDNPPT